LIRSAEAQYAISSSLRFVKQKQVYNLKNLWGESSVNQDCPFYLMNCQRINKDLIV
jgi:hypothetical protein